jgi:ankyrin repeat protein
MSEALMEAAREGDLEKLKRLAADEADVAEVDASSCTALLWAALFGHIPIMHWLLNEAGSSLAEKTIEGMSALLLTALRGRFPAMKYLLVEQGASISESNNDGDTVWSIIFILRTNLDESAELFIANPKLSPQHLDICTRGRQLRAQLPSYLEQQRAALVAQCPLPAVLRCLVAEYAVTTPEDMWADGLRM